MADKHKRFENEGVVFKAKLIGSELVMEPRGDKMCQNSIQRLKAIIKGTNSHKKRIVLKISYDGVKVFDEKTNELLHHHEVSQISYIASDDTDSRTFGYVSDVPNKAHQFICFKTSGPAIDVMSAISALFEAVLEKKHVKSNRKQLVDENNHGINRNLPPTSTKYKDFVDLIDDSTTSNCKTGTMIQDDNSKPSAVQPHWSTLLENSIGSTASSFKNYNRQTDLIDDVFSNLSDPIIVGQNDSLISYKPQNPDQISTTPTNIINSNRFPYIGTNVSGRSITSDNSNASITTADHNDTTDSITRVVTPPYLPRSTHHPIPRRQHGQQHGVLLPPPSSLPRPTPMMMPSIPTHNRSLIYNHSSVSLSDAALTNRPSMDGNSAASPLSNCRQVDRYAVFNDIDNLPSIFESTSLGNVSKVIDTKPKLDPLSNSMVATSIAAGCNVSSSANNMFRQTNPFDDDFFA